MFSEASRAARITVGGSISEVGRWLCPYRENDQETTWTPMDTPASPDDIVMETITSAEVFQNRLKIRGDMRGCDAMEIAFHNLALSGVDLSGASLVRCQFGGCDFRDANLRGVNFEGAVFRDSKFAGANLWGANFWGADITGIPDFTRAALSHTNFFWIYATRSGEISGKQYQCYSFGRLWYLCRTFSYVVDMSEDSTARTFVGLNHRYFRMMFGKNSDRAFRTRTLLTLVDTELPNKSMKSGKPV